MMHSEAGGAGETPDSQPAQTSTPATSSASADSGGPAKKASTSPVRWSSPGGIAKAGLDRVSSHKETAKDVGLNMIPLYSGYQFTRASITAYQTGDFSQWGGVTGWIDELQLQLGFVALDSTGAGEGISALAPAARALLEAGTKDVASEASSAAIAANTATTASRVSTPLWTATKSKSAAENALSHFNKHGSEFPHLDNSLEYVAEAQGFLPNPSASTHTRVRGSGDIVRYDPVTDVFGVMDSSGAPRTFLRPDPTSHGFPSNLDYFNAQ